MLDCCVSNMRRQVSYEEGVEVADKWKAVGYMEVSAKSGYNVKHLFALLARQIIVDMMSEENVELKKNRNCLVL